MKKFTAADLAFIGVMTAALCVAAPFSIPIPVSPVPLSLATFVVYLSVFLLGQKKAALSALLYLLIGLIGVPVFSGFAGGPAKLVGPTGGYLIMYPFLALLSGYFIERFSEKRIVRFVALILGTALLYAVGTIWLAAQLHLGAAAALMAGVIPYLPGDAVKIIVAGVLGPQIKKQLTRAGIQMTPYKKEEKSA